MAGVWLRTRWRPCMTRYGRKAPGEKWKCPDPRYAEYLITIKAMDRAKGPGRPRREDQHSGRVDAPGRV